MSPNQTSDNSGNLVKAQLISSEVKPNIEFMFNPSELLFERSIAIKPSDAAHTEKKGIPKVSFSHIEACKVTINKIIFDTYEDGEDVNKYINNFKRAVEFVDGKERPPIYTFIWGGQIHLRCCFIDKLTYKFTMFLPNGTPVRAVIDSLILKESDETELSPEVNRQISKEARKAEDIDRKHKNGSTQKITNTRIV
jgi:hypothetical protein